MGQAADEETQQNADGGQAGVEQQAMLAKRQPRGACCCGQQRQTGQGGGQGAAEQSGLWAIRHLQDERHAAHDAAAIGHEIQRSPAASRRCQIGQGVNGGVKSMQPGILRLSQSDKSGLVGGGFVIAGLPTLILIKHQILRQGEGRYCKQHGNDREYDDRGKKQGPAGAVRHGSNLGIAWRAS